MSELRRGLRRTIRRALSSFRFHSLFVRNFAISAILLVVPLALVTNYVISRSAVFVEEQIGLISLQSLYRTRDAVDSLAAQATELARYLADSADIQIAARSGIADVILGRDYLVAMTGRLKQALAANRELVSIYVYSDRNDTIIDAQGRYPFATYPDRGWIDLFDSVTGSKLVVRPRAMVNATASPPHPVVDVISVVITMSAVGSESNYGAVVVNAGLEDVSSEPATGEEERASGFLLVDDAHSIFHGRGDPVFQAVAEALAADPGRLLECSECWSRQRIDAKDYILVTAVSESHPWRYATFLPSEVHVARIGSLKRFTGVLVAVMLATALMASFLISLRTYRPIASLMEALDRGAGAPQSRRLEPDRESDEERYIANRIASLSYSSTHLREELDRQLEAVDRIQRTALDAQIQPHFLYNTLETIKWAAMELSSGENKASEMISDLASLLRISLDRDNMLPLATEVEHARLYVRLLESRYAGKFRVLWEVDQSLLAHRTVKLVLQPLIENAIYHGLKPRRFCGAIDVAIRESDGAIALSVRDDGVGIPPNALTELRERLDREAGLEGDHIGMRNVNQRIRLAFGEGFGLSVASEQGSWTEVTVLIPKG